MQLELRTALGIGLPSPPASDGNVERLAIREPVKASRPDFLEAKPEIEAHAGQTSARLSARAEQ